MWRELGLTDLPGLTDRIQCRLRPRPRGPGDAQRGFGAPERPFSSIQLDGVRLADALEVDIGPSRPGLRLGQLTLSRGKRDDLRA
jgi:hypothetical protein